MIRKLSWLVAIAAGPGRLLRGGIGWLSSGLKQMVTVGGPFTDRALQTRDP
jgi:hypothetical protein